MVAIPPPGGGGSCSSSEVTDSAGSGSASVVSGADGIAGSEGGACFLSTGTSQMASPVMTTTSTMSVRVRPGLQFPPLTVSLFSFAMRHLLVEFTSPGGIMANIGPG